MYNIQYRYVYMGEEFEFDGQKYTKTSFQRGYFIKNNKKVFRNFKKNTVVKSSHREYDEICYK